MSRIFWERGGFTVTELLISMLFAGIVVATLYGFFFGGSSLPLSPRKLKLQRWKMRAEA